MYNDSKFGYFLVVATLIISTRMFSFTLLDDRVFDYLEILTSLSMVALAVSAKKARQKKKAIFSPFVKAIITLTLISAIPAYLFHDQNLDLSLLASRTIFFWLLYFVLHKYYVSAAKIESILIMFGLVWSAIMIFQQFTYPVLFFNELLAQTKNEIQIDVDRGGLLRIFVSGEIFATFLVFYSWRKIQQNSNARSLVLMLIGILGLFLTGSRQVIFSTLFVIGVDALYSSKLSNITSTRFLVMVMLIIGGIYFFALDYLTTLVELSMKQNVSSKNYIRNLEIKYFLFDYWPNGIAVLLGNGWEHASSEYGKNILFIKEGLKFYRSDVGLVGALNKFGMLYCIAILSLFYKLIIPNKKIHIPGYIRLVFIYCLITSFTTGNYFERGSIYCCLICLLYIIDQKNGNRSNTHSNLQSAGDHKKRFSNIV